MQPRPNTPANTNDHDQLALQVIDALQELQRNEERISFYSVAAKAQVARSTLYRRPDLKQLVMSARSDPAGLIQDLPTEIKEAPATTRRESPNQLTTSKTPVLRSEIVYDELIRRIATLETALVHLLFKQNTKTAQPCKPECYYAFIGLDKAA